MEELTAHQAVPELDSGLTVLHTPSTRSAALHHLVINELVKRRGETLWVDARNNATSYTLYDLAPNESILEHVHLSRAFTAYQHYELVRELVRRASANTDLIVIPCVASLYRDSDVPDHESTALLESVLVILRELSATLDVPVLLTNTGDDELTTLVEHYTDVSIECRHTSMGLAYESEDIDFETLVYWHEGYWQTTIPYWVELFGTVQDTDPATVAIDVGLVEVV